MKKNVLTEFQEYLSSNSRVQEKYIPSIRNWARKFLHINDCNLQYFIELYLANKREGGK